MKRTRPKGDPDPGWQRIGWDEALDLSRHEPAARWRTSTVRRASSSAPSRPRRPRSSTRSTGSAPAAGLRHAQPAALDGALRLGPLPGAALHLWRRRSPGVLHARPRARRLHPLLGLQPSVARLSHATATVAALQARRPPDRRRPAARRAGQQGRPLAAGAARHRRAPSPSAIAGVMIERGWYDAPSSATGPTARCSCAPTPVACFRAGRLTEATPTYVAWDEAAARPVLYDPATRRYDAGRAAPALTASTRAADGEVPCRPGFQLVADLCRRYTPETVEADHRGPARPGRGGRAPALGGAARRLFYSWSGVEQHTNVTQIARAIGLLYALTGSFDAPGGNVLFPSVPSADRRCRSCCRRAQRAGALACASVRSDLPASGSSPARTLPRHPDGDPYPVRGLVGFGANLLLAHADSRRGRASAGRPRLLRPRRPLHEPHRRAGRHRPAGRHPVRARSPQDRLRRQRRRPNRSSSCAGRWSSLAARRAPTPTSSLTWPAGSASASTSGTATSTPAYRHQLGPVRHLARRPPRQPRRRPRARSQTRHRKYAEETDGVPRGFATPTRKVELLLRDASPITATRRCRSSRSR